MSVTVQQDATMYSLLYFCKLLYMFRVVTPPIIRSTYNCNYSIWHWKLLYMFRVVTPPIIRSTYNCNYSIWHWSNVGKCSVWSQLKMRGMDPPLLPSAIVEGSRDGSMSFIFSWLYTLHFPKFDQYQMQFSSTVAYLLFIIIPQTVKYKKEQIWFFKIKSIWYIRRPTQNFREFKYTAQTVIATNLNR